MLRTSGKNSSRANKCFGNYLFEAERPTVKLVSLCYTFQCQSMSTRLKNVMKLAVLAGVEGDWSFLQPRLEK